MGHRAHTWEGKKEATHEEQRLGPRQRNSRAKALRQERAVMFEHQEPVTVAESAEGGAVGGENGEVGGAWGRRGTRSCRTGAHSLERA